MNEESVLEYYTKNATPEQTRLVRTMKKIEGNILGIR